MRERIIAAGAPGSGKTYAWLTIARMLPDVTFHVLDPDDGVLRVWKSEFPEVHNLNYYFTPSWSDELKDYEEGKMGGIVTAYKEIAKIAKPQDWVIVEMAGNIWGMVQTEFTTKVFNEGVGEYFLKARQEMRQGSSRLEALKGWTDWLVINKMHNEDLMNPICYKLPCHVFMTTSLSITTPSAVAKEEAEQRAFYGDTLIRVEGQKHNVFRAQSIFTFTRRKKEWFFSTFIKDRGRSFIQDDQLFDFGMQYLVGVAGWEI